MPKESAGSYVCLRQAPPGLVECEQRRIVGAVAAAEVEDPDALLVHRVRLHRAVCATPPLVRAGSSLSDLGHGLPEGSQKGKLLEHRDEQIKWQKKAEPH